MDRERLLFLYRAMLAARLIDQAERQLAQRGEAFFHVPGTGHEGSVALQPHLIADDWLHCHYRQKALLIARGVPIKTFFSILFCKDESPSRGRQMSGFFSDPKLNILNMVVPTANNALQSVGVAAAVKDKATRPIVMTAVGDGSTQQGEFLEAIGQAVRCNLPVMFFIEDNRWAISTTTEGKTFFSLPDGMATEFYGLPIHYVNGRNVPIATRQLGDIVSEMRETRGPSLVVFQVERLASHTNADDHSIYRSAAELQYGATNGDPLRNLERDLLEAGVARAVLDDIAADLANEIAVAEAAAFAGRDPVPVRVSKRPIHAELTHPSREVTGNTNAPRLTMRDALRETLRHHLSADSRVSLSGEDIEDPKGDVFGVTRGLSSQFPGRVRNSPLSESTILGEAIGRSLTGERPVAFIQFADFLPLALNQIVSEMATMEWRSDGQWSSPVIVMIACGGYRAGLGPFHAQTYESVLAHTPGIDVLMPSTAGDAAGLLNAAFQSERPTIFLYPKAVLNDPLHTTSADVSSQFAPIGVARKARVGRDITLVGWGNTVRICEQVAEALEKAGVEAEVFDLRSISPWDERAILASAEKTARLVVVHEDNHTCGLGAEIMATIAEKTRVPVAMRRVTRPDTYIPCNFANQIEILPSFQRVLATAADLLNLDLTWLAPPREEPGVVRVEAIGSAPSDETVVVADFCVTKGDAVERGDVLASLEASKSVFELTSPVSGIVEDLAAKPGDTVRVGTPLISVRTEVGSQRAKPITKENAGTPVLKRRAPTVTLPLPRRESRSRAFDVGISQVVAVTGSRRVTNDELTSHRRAMSSEDIVRRTGIESRHWAAPGETAVNMAVHAGRELLDREQLMLDDLDLVICSTTSPTSVTPSMACQVLNGLGNGKSDAMLQAYDINAACSGYLYALQSAYDFLQSRPDGRVLVVTAEVLSPLLDPEDFDTAILFGDATSATLLYGETHFQRAKARLVRPEVSAKGEDGSTLSVPFRHGGHIHMKGQKVFTEAVRAMVSSLNRVCDHQGLRVNDLNLVVPHQANQRIIDAIQSRVPVAVYSNIRHHGNTSSSSIPLCLMDVLPQSHPGERIGLCAFGGGFTFGASILQSI